MVLPPVLALLLLTTAGEDPEQLAWVAQVLAPESPATTAQKFQALKLCEETYAETESGLVTSLLFRAASTTYEGSPELRRAAVNALGAVLATSRNTMYARRLARLADAQVEPEAIVRIAVLRALPRMDNSIAHARVFDSLKPTLEPDPQVREAARQIIAGNPNLAASL